MKIWFRLYSALWSSAEILIHSRGSSLGLFGCLQLLVTPARRAAPVGLTFLDGPAAWSTCSCECSLLPWHLFTRTAGTWLTHPHSHCSPYLLLSPSRTYLSLPSLWHRAHTEHTHTWLHYIHVELIIISPEVHSLRNVLGAPTLHLEADRELEAYKVDIMSF